MDAAAPNPTQLVPAAEGRELTIRLDGADEDAGLADFGDFTRFCDAVRKCLRRVERIVAGQPNQIRFRVADLRIKCALATIEPVAIGDGAQGDLGGEVVAFFRETVARIESGGDVDPRYGYDDFLAFRELTNPLNWHAEKVFVGRAELTSNFTAHIEELLKGGDPAEGTVSGYIQRLNVHNKREFFLYPVGETQAVCCAFKDRQLEDVRRGIERYVTVSGLLYYGPDAVLPHRVQVEAITVHPEPGKLPRLTSLRGSLGKGALGGKTSVEYVRALRDEQDQAD